MYLFTENYHPLTPLLTLQPLLHEACLAGVEVSTLDLLLNILAEKDLDINSKNVVRLWHAYSPH